MGHHLIDVHHIRVLMVHVEQVDLVGQNAAVEAALLHQHDVKAQRIGIDYGRAHAAGGALAADDQRLHAELGEMRNERRAEEYARTLLGDDDVLRLRLELRPDGVIGRKAKKSIITTCCYCESRWGKHSGKRLTLVLRDESGNILVPDRNRGKLPWNNRNTITCECPKNFMIDSSLKRGRRTGACTRRFSTACEGRSKPLLGLPRLPPTPKKESPAWGAGLLKFTS